MATTVRGTLAALAAATLCPAALAETTFIETFDDGSNHGAWTWGTGNEQISPVNGNPGAHLEDLTLFSCCPGAGTSFGVASTFTGDYRDRNVTSVGIDLITLDADFSVGARPLTVMLINDNDTPFNLEDDWGAYFIGDENVPQAGVPALLGGAGWKPFHFDIPVQEATTPDGWVTFSFNGEIKPDWNDVVTDVDVLRFFYGDPTQNFLFMNWDVGMDNPRITEGEPAVPGDLDGDGEIGVSDLLQLLGAWGDCADVSDCAADLDGDGAVGVGDLLAMLASWGG